jgi:hypothetical protein
LQVDPLSIFIFFIFYFKKKKLKIKVGTWVNVVRSYTLR